MHNSLRKSFSFLFGFSAGEAGAFTVLMPLLGLVLYSEPIWDHFHPSPSPVIEAEILDSLLETQSGIQLFSFDPNTVSEAGLDSLGMNSYLAGRLIRYRAAGGRFRHPNDLLRLHGLDTNEFKRLEPWVKISGLSVKKAETADRDKRAEQRFTKPLPAPRTFDLNQADTIDFEAWPGIGHKTAVRIMRYRDALGGFINREQLYEVWAIDSLTVFSMDRFFIHPQFTPKQIDLNSATEDELEQHPYLSRQQARAILFYRYQHGVFRSAEDLKKVRLLDESILRKIRPYVKAEDRAPD